MMYQLHSDKVYDLQVDAKKGELERIRERKERKKRNSKSPTRTKRDSRSPPKTRSSRSATRSTKDNVKDDSVSPSRSKRANGNKEDSALPSGSTKDTQKQEDPKQREESKQIDAPKQKEVKTENIDFDLVDNLLGDASEQDDDQGKADYKASSRQRLDNALGGVLGLGKTPNDEGSVCTAASGFAELASSFSSLDFGSDHNSNSLTKKLNVPLGGSASDLSKSIEDVHNIIQKTRRDRSQSRERGRRDRSESLGRSGHSKKREDRSQSRERKLSPSSQRGRQESKASYIHKSRSDRRDRSESLGRSGHSKKREDRSQSRERKISPSSQRGRQESKANYTQRDRSASLERGPHFTNMTSNPLLDPTAIKKPLSLQRALTSPLCERSESSQGESDSGSVLSRISRRRDRSESRERFRRERSESRGRDRSESCGRNTDCSRKEDRSQSRERQLSPSDPDSANSSGIPFIGRAANRQSPPRRAQSMPLSDDSVLGASDSDSVASRRQDRSESREGGRRDRSESRGRKQGDRSESQGRNAGHTRKEDRSQSRERQASPPGNRWGRENEGIQSQSNLGMSGDRAAPPRTNSSGNPFRIRAFNKKAPPQRAHSMPLSEMNDSMLDESYSDSVTSRRQDHRECREERRRDRSQSRGRNHRDRSESRGRSSDCKRKGGRSQSRERRVSPNDSSGNGGRRESSHSGNQKDRSASREPPRRANSSGNPFRRAPPKRTQSSSSGRHRCANQSQQQKALEQALKSQSNLNFLDDDGDEDEQAEGSIEAPAEEEGWAKWESDPFENNPFESLGGSRCSRSRMARTNKESATPSKVQPGTYKSLVQS